MFDHYIAVDWAQSVMAIARLTKTGKKAEVFELPANISELKFYINSKKGTKKLIFEESTCAQWMYTELKNEVDDLVVCDPKRNRYLTAAQQTDKIDAIKLAELGFSNLLKPVYHSGDVFISLRNLVSGYEDTIKAGVRFKNQRLAILRANHANFEDEISSKAHLFVLKGLNESISRYEEEKSRYKKQFEELSKEYPVLRRLRTIPGIDLIGAIKIAARVVDPTRFSSKQKFFAYCGLIKYEKHSGGKSYGKKNPAFCRTLKCVFNTAALSAINTKRTDTYMGRYIEYLKTEKRYPDHHIRRTVSRHIAAISLGVMKGKRFDVNHKRKALKIN